MVEADYASNTEIFMIEPQEKYCEFGIMQLYEEAIGLQQQAVLRDGQKIIASIEPVAARFYDISDMPQEMYSDKLGCLHGNKTKIKHGLS